MPYLLFIRFQSFYTTAASSLYSSTTLLRRIRNSCSVSAKLIALRIFHCHDPFNAVTVYAFHGQLFFAFNALDVQMQ